MTPFYTKTGDDGTTGLLGDERVEKFDLRIETVGTLDELSAAIGLARSLSLEPVKEDLKTLQISIYQGMAEVAATAENEEKFRRINKKSVDELEGKIEAYSTKTRIPAGFILPGDSTASAAISLARSIARRAERRLVELVHRDNLKNHELLRFFNRLSSFLYILEIYSVQSDDSVSLTLANRKNT
ncbi:MAG: cobalamin adenosyltransferase [Chloroflexi bacterium]|nr:MAG: cobalamin adenosyltransferase [Chloroflexota bacterium]MBA4375357.1 ATP:cob(I)alamin adenosyltransferase [Anaerolinea sp.]